MQWYLAVLKNYVGFSGRARRTEYWMYTLINAIIIVILSVLGAIPHLGFFLILGYLYELGILLPSVAVTVRRLHDTNKSGWWILIGLIPLVGGIVLLIFTVLPGDRGPNRYGDDPKGVPAGLRRPGLSRLLKALPAVVARRLWWLRAMRIYSRRKALVPQ